jgi:ABC-2 type transport system permease protein
VAGVFAALAYAASARRDLGAGIIQQRPGSATASEVLGTPLGFAYRLQRSLLIWWGVAMFAFGSVYGSFIPEVESFADESTAVQDFIPEVSGATLTDSYIGLLMSMFAMVVSVYAVQAVLRLRTEETTGRAEATLGTALSRTRWVATHLVFALAGPAIVLLLTAAGLGISAGVAGDDMSMIGTTVGAALPLVPALWVAAGLALALFGVVPRAAAFAWGVLVYSLFVGIFGSLLQLPDWMFNLSPFAHVPSLPAEDLAWAPLLILTAIAAALVAIGITGFRRRDVYTT